MNVTISHIRSMPKLTSADPRGGLNTRHMRRHLHTIPELMYDLPKTSAYIRYRLRSPPSVLCKGCAYKVLQPMAPACMHACRSQLDDMGIKYKHPVAESGILASLGQGEPKFALRTDMDALPIEVCTSVYTCSWSSLHRCHATQKLPSYKVCI